MGNDGKRKVVVEGKALEQLKRERAEMIDGHLEQWGNITSITNQAIDLALEKEIGYAGVPIKESEQEEVLERCVRMGQKIAHERLKRYNQGVADICELLNVRDMPDHIRWAALKAAGVKLPDIEPEKPEETGPKLITSH